MKDTPNHECYAMDSRGWTLIDKYKIGFTVCVDPCESMAQGPHQVNFVHRLVASAWAAVLAWLDPLCFCGCAVS